MSAFANSNNVFTQNGANATWGGPMLDPNIPHGNPFASLARPPPRGNNNNNNNNNNRQRNASNGSARRRTASNNQQRANNNNSPAPVNPQPNNEQPIAGIPMGPANPQNAAVAVAGSVANPPSFVGLLGSLRKLKNVTINGVQVPCSHAGHHISAGAGASLDFDQIKDFLYQCNPGTPISLEVRQSGTDNEWVSWSGYIANHAFRSETLGRPDFRGCFVHFDVRESAEIQAFVREWTNAPNIVFAQDTPFVEICVPLRGVDYKSITTYRVVAYSVLGNAEQDVYVLDLPKSIEALNSAQRSHAAANANSASIARVAPSLAPTVLGGVARAGTNLNLNPVLNEILQRPTADQLQAAQALGNNNAQRYVAQGNSAVPITNNNTNMNNGGFVPAASLNNNNDANNGFGQVAPLPPANGNDDDEEAEEDDEIPEFEAHDVKTWFVFAGKYPNSHPTTILHLILFDADDGLRIAKRYKIGKNSVDVTATKDYNTLHTFVQHIFECRGHVQPTFVTLAQKALNDLRINAEPHIDKRAVIASAKAVKNPNDLLAAVFAKHQKSAPKPSFGAKNKFAPKPSGKNGESSNFKGGSSAPTASKQQ